jgi:hypothetical protein
MQVQLPLVDGLPWGLFWLGDFKPVGVGIRVGPFFFL